MLWARCLHTVPYSNTIHSRSDLCCRTSVCCASGFADSCNSFSLASIITKLYIWHIDHLHYIYVNILLLACLPACLPVWCCAVWCCVCVSVIVWIPFAMSYRQHRLVSNIQKLVLHMIWRCKRQTLSTYILHREPVIWSIQIEICVIKMYMPTAQCVLYYILLTTSTLMLRIRISSHAKSKNTSIFQTNVYAQLCRIYRLHDDNDDDERNWYGNACEPLLLNS